MNCDTTIGDFKEMFYHFVKIFRFGKYSITIKSHKTSEEMFEGVEL